MRVGVVGLGFRMFHVLREFVANEPGLRVVGYVDPAPAGLPGLTESGIEAGSAFDDLATLLREPLDLLMVGSPNHLHLGHIEQGLRAGVRVFSEKPVVTTEEDSYALARLLREFGRDRVMVGLVLRYSPLYVDLRKAQAEGWLGAIASIEASEHIAPYHGAFFMRDWRRYDRFAGNFLLEKCCHDLDLYGGLVGHRARQVASFGGRKSFVPSNAPEAWGANDTAVYHKKPSGWMGTDKVFDSDADIIDYQTALVEYADGATLAFHTNLNVPDEFRRFCVMGTRGMAEGDFVRNFFRVHDARTGEKRADRCYEGLFTEGHYGADAQMARDVLAHLHGHTSLPVSTVDALEAGLTAIKIDEARRTRRVVDLTDAWQRFDDALGGAGGDAPASRSTPDGH